MIDREGAPAVGITVDDLDPATPLTVAVPDDITALRRGDPATASLWRVAVREALVPLFDRGWSITGFDRGPRLPGGTAPAPDVDGRSVNVRRRP